MGEAVYLLCFVTSAAVAFLLLRGYMRTRHRIMLWSGLGFIGLCLNNLMLVVDLVVFPDSVDLSLWRQVPAALGLALLIFGLIWDSD